MGKPKCKQRNPQSSITDGIKFGIKTTVTTNQPMTARIVLNATPSVVEAGGMDINTFIEETRLYNPISADQKSAGATLPKTTTTAGNSKDKSTSEFASNDNILQVIPEGDTKSLDPTTMSILDQSSPEQMNPTGGYQNRLRYALNKDFSGNRSSMFIDGSFDSFGRSVPNTFRYKNHPNAKTKHSFTMLASNEKTSETSKFDNRYILQQDQQDPSAKIQESENQDENIPPLKTSTIEKPNSLKTPSWMPDVLNEKWDSQSVDDPGAQRSSGPPLIGGLDFNSSVRITKRQSQPQFNSFKFDKEHGSINTVLHNSDLQSAETPVWKRVNNEYNQHFKPMNNMQNIFHTIESHEETNNNNKSISTTNISTPMITKQLSVPKELSQDNSTQLENILEQDKTRTPHWVKNPESPLKLYQAEYDTFTKQKLTGVLQQLQGKSAMNTPTNNEKGPNPERDDNATQPLAIKNFVKSRAYDKDYYLKNADNVFKNIQKRGYRVASTNFNESKITSQSTATSTPKVTKISNSDNNISCENEYASYTSGFESHEEDAENENNHQSEDVEEGETMSNNYTSLAKESDMHADSPNQSSGSDSVYTFDAEGDESDGKHEQNSTQNNTTEYREGGLKSPHIAVGEKHDPATYQEKLDRAKFLRDENKQLQESINVLNPIIKSTASPDVLKQADHVGIIKWKNASQLRMTPPEENHANVIKGRVMPSEDLPTEYGDMVLDNNEHRWRPKNKAENYPNTLESIEDLTTTTNDLDRETLSPTRAPADQSILKKGQSWSSKRRNSSNKLEVSFHVPSEPKTSPGVDVTRMSQLDSDFTFSQSNQKLISIINEILTLGDAGDISWEDVNEIRLSDHDLNNVKDLDVFLPNLRSLDLSSNEIKYLVGVPERILKLILLDNVIDDMTSFSGLYDLQMLDVSRNDLTQVSNLKECIHLTSLNLSQNNINNIARIGHLVNLINLDLSGNQLSGHLSFQMFDFPNLQDLNLNENRLEVVSGIENLPSLRILNLNENRLEHLSSGYHKNLKKLLLKFNNLKLLDLESFPYLRCLRIDGNRNLDAIQVRRLEKIEEVSCKAIQPRPLDALMLQANDVKELDLSGNLQLAKSLPRINFRYVSKLTLLAVNLTSIPENFHVVFPNVQNLNLNFNKLNDVSGLSQLRLTKCYLVSNNIESLDALVKALYPSRKSLISLDVRLNPLSMNMYPFMFSPDETNGIHLETADDIENFSIHYRSLKRMEDWYERDREYCARGNLERRKKYECIMLGMFKNLAKLDGISITKEKRRLVNDFV